MQWLNDGTDWQTDAWQFHRPCAAYYMSSVNKITQMLKETSISHLFHLTSVLWHCCLGVKKSIRPVKIEWWGVSVFICLEQGADCLHMVQLIPVPSPSSLASFKSRLVLPFWYRLTQVVLEKRPLNGCSSMSSSSFYIRCVDGLTKVNIRSTHQQCHTAVHPPCMLLTSLCECVE